jgi:hypothetical protein
MAESIPGLGKAGGWNNRQFPLDQDAQNVIEKVQDQLPGVGYTPWAFATQLVNGTNYAFVCGAQAVAPNEPQDVVLIEAHVPPGGEPHVASLTRINP